MQTLWWLLTHKLLLLKQSALLKWRWCCPLNGRTPPQAEIAKWRMRWCIYVRENHDSCQPEIIKTNRKEFTPQEQVEYFPVVKGERNIVLELWALWYRYYSRVERTLFFLYLFIFFASSNFFHIFIIMKKVFWHYNCNVTFSAPNSKTIDFLRSGMLFVWLYHVRRFFADPYLQYVPHVPSFYNKLCSSAIIYKVRYH